MPESDSNRKRSRSRSPSDSEQPKQHKRANTGAVSQTDDPSAPPTSNTPLTPTFTSAATNDVNMTDPLPALPTDSATSATADTAKGSPDTSNPMNLSSHINAFTSGAPAPSTATSTPPSAHIHMRCLIVTQDASIIIGKGGAHVNEIREKSGARVMVSESIPGNPERILNVSGPLDAVSKAFGLIVRRINDEPFDVPSVPGSRAVTIKFMIPNSRMGSVIGKQGSKIKEIQDASGARLNASEGMLPGSTEAQERMPSSSHSSYRPSNRRSGGYVGSSYVPGSSAGYSNPYLHGVNNPAQQLQTQQIYIPNDLVGCIIGKGGSKINEIRHMSASQIKIMEPGAGPVGSAPGGSEGERLVVITGPPANIQMAVQLLYHRLEQEKQKQVRAVGGYPP
ncbi:hypothetical protein B0F90DRAFT_1689611 [Multifurca ochricompacta]|uniref:K Homology domain-containing protein n=1 Tax=Multifurca ochricompacta TaxID=376703 RepID=A0AAD4M9Q9_9AGAM|nr:hypothetical protein B0F90DRAFT_1689611 [Multifurca ochricompacta]